MLCLPRHRGIARRAFSLMEIMIAVVIIGLLAAMAIPAFKRVHRHAVNKRYINDVRQIRDGVERYAMEVGNYPPNGTASLHASLRGYVSEKLFGASPLGGVWDWDYEQEGIKAMVSVYQYTANAEQLTEIDRTIDDGDLSTGLFRQINSKVCYILEQ